MVREMKTREGIRPKRRRAPLRAKENQSRINAAQSECMHTNLTETNRIRSGPAISFATMPLLFEFDHRGSLRAMLQKRGYNNIGR